jgi:hypothetical protein
VPLGFQQRFRRRSGGVASRTTIDVVSAMAAHHVHIASDLADVDRDSTRGFVDASSACRLQRGEQPTRSPP